VKIPHQERCDFNFLGYTRSVTGDLPQEGRDNMTAKSKQVIPKLKLVIWKKSGKHWNDGIFLLPDSGLLQTSNVAQSAIRELGVAQLVYPLYIPDLVPSNYRSFPKMDQH